MQDPAHPVQLAEGQFIGTVVKTGRAVDAQFTMVRHDHWARLPLHSHDQAYFCLLLHGRYSEHYQNKSIQYSPFTIAFHPSRYSHSDEVGANSVFFVIELSDAWRQRLRSVIDLRSVKVELRGKEMVWLAMRIFKEFVENFHEDSVLTIESLLYELIAIAAHLPEEQSTADSPWFNAALRFLDRQFTEQVSVKSVAAAAGVHPVTLTRAFRLNLQLTMSDYLNRLRVRRACELILNGQAKLSAISADCGYTDQSYFTKVFKAVTGTTPAVFRQTFSRAM